MKKYILSILIMAALMLSGCFEFTFVTFEKPQPKHAKSLTSFPKRLQGKYIDSTDQNSVTITDKLIIENWKIEFKEHKDSLDLIYHLIGDTLIDLKSEKAKRVYLLGDTMVYHNEGIDTLFNISSVNILKKFKGCYFLNYSIDSVAMNVWYVQKLDLHEDTLIISNISNDDIKILYVIAGISPDTDSSHFSLTRRQFKRFIKQGGFSEQERNIRKRETGPPSSL